MKSLSIAFAVFAFAQAQLPTTVGTGPRTTAGPVSREHWQRVLTLPAATPTVEQCVVLDADIFAHAAAGLRDMRLLQGGRELPYAVDESHDDRETGTGVPLPDDRSIYDTVGVSPLTNAAGHDAMAEPLRTSGRRATFVLPARVPVERITLHGNVNVPVKVHVRATPRPAASGSTPSTEAEIVALEAASGHPSLPVTLGANLQDTAVVTVDVVPAPPSVSAVAFEMRRREVCYQPITAAPVHMIFGDPEAEPVHYDYAAHYKPTATPVLAVMGPRETNPAYQPPIVAQAFVFTTKQKLGMAMGLCVGMLAVTLGSLLRMRR
jgi:hypothetical protein